MGKTVRDWAGPLGLLLYTLELSTAGFHVALYEASDAALCYQTWDWINLQFSPCGSSLMMIAFCPRSPCHPVPVNHKIQKYILSVP